MLQYVYLMNNVIHLILSFYCMIAWHVTWPSKCVKNTYIHLTNLLGDIFRIILAVEKVFCFSIGMKIPTIVKEAQTSLENGCCVVIGLQSTGEVQEFTIMQELVPISKKIGRMNFNVCKVEEIFTCTCRLYKFSFHLFDFLGFIWEWI